MIDRCGLAPETMTLGQRLKVAREVKGFSKIDVHQRTQVSTSSLAKVERDEKEFYLESLVPLADLYGVTLEYFFGKREMGSKQPLNGPVAELVKSNLITLSERIVFARIVKNIKQTEAARGLNVKENTVYAYERFGVQPSPKKLVQMAELYQVSAAWLLGRSEIGAPELPRSLAERLLFARALNCLSTLEVEEEIGVVRNSVRNYETGRTEPTLQVLEKLTKLYRLPIDFFPPVARSFPEDLTTLGGRLQHARKNKGYSQREIEEYTGINRSIISQYERNARIPHQEHLKRLCEVYGLEKKWVQTGPQDIPPVEPMRKAHATIGDGVCKECNRREAHRVS